jgi:hypothetical protein
MATADQNIITLHRERSGFYMNIVMLDDAFNPKLLVLSNKVIVNDACDIKTSAKKISVSNAGLTWVEVCSEPHLMLRGQVKYNDELFIFTDEGLKFRKCNLSHAAFECEKQNNVAMLITNDCTTFNFGATIQIKAKST